MIRLTAAGLALLVATAIGTLAIVAVLTTDLGRLMLAYAVGML
jgi:hypothetical protein